MEGAEESPPLPLDSGEASRKAGDSAISPTHVDLWRGDCVRGMAGLENESVDVVVTSPPYNLGIRYRSYNDDVQREEYLKWTRSWVGEVARLLRPGGSLFLNIGAAPSNPLLPHQIALQISEQLVLQNTFHWIKSISVRTPDGIPLSVGHFKPLQSKRYITDCHEYLFHFTHRGNVALDRLAIGVPYQDKSNVGRWKHTGGRDKRCRGNTWFIPYKTIMSRKRERPHPATFPVELAVQCIRLHGAGPESRVMDPFLGIGHTALAAVQCGVGRFVGFEIEAEYLRTARELLDDCNPRPGTVTLQEPDN